MNVIKNMIVLKMILIINSKHGIIYGLEKFKDFYNINPDNILKKIDFSNNIDNKITIDKIYVENRYFNINLELIFENNDYSEWILKIREICCDLSSIEFDINLDYIMNNFFVKNKEEIIILNLKLVDILNKLEKKNKPIIIENGNTIETESTSIINEDDNPGIPRVDTTLADLNIEVFYDKDNSEDESNWSKLSDLNGSRFPGNSEPSATNVNECDTKWNELTKKLFG